jgi:hypothetical protein
MPRTAARNTAVAASVVLTSWLVLADVHMAATALELAQVAAGGSTALKAVKALVAKGQGRTLNEAFAGRPQGNVQFIRSDIDIKLLLPDHYLKVEAKPFSTTHLGFAGATLLDAAFTRGGQPAETLKWKDQMSLRRDDCARLVLLLLLRGDAPNALALKQSAAPLTIDVTGLAGPMQLDIDPVTHLPLRLKYRLAERSRTGELTGQFSEITEAPGDYRAVGDVRLPFRLTYSREGQLLREVTFSDIQINPRLAPVDFAKKD